MATKAKEKVEKIEYISPNEKLTAVDKDIAVQEKNAKNLVIDSTKSYEEANALLIEIKSRIKRIKALKDEIVKPLKDHVAKLEAPFKEKQKTYETLEATVKRSMADYQRAEAEKSRKEEERLQKLADKRAERAKEQGKEIDPTPVATVQRQETTVKSDTGSSTASKVVKFEVTDVHALPDNIKKQVLENALAKGLVDTVVRTHVKANGMQTDIAGVRVYEDYEISVRA